jgi:hypothetical protein
MAFVKLDIGILESTLWTDRGARDVFITSLLMAEPREITNPTPQLEPDGLQPTGFIVPPGWYGFVPAAGIGIIRRAMVNQDEGMDALRVLGSSDVQSRSTEHDGRRLVRVNGGFIVLNFMKYRDKDHTAAVRQARLRARRKGLSVTEPARDVTPLQTVTGRDVTQSDADTDADTEDNSTPRRGRSSAPNCTESAKWYCNSFSVVGEKAYGTVRQGIELETKTSTESPQEIANRMIEARQSFSAIPKADVEFDGGHVWFISSGTYKKPESWRKARAATPAPPKKNLKGEQARLQALESELKEAGRRRREAEPRQEATE